MLATALKDVLFAMQFGQSVDASGCALLVLAAGSVVGVSAEHVVCRDVYEQSVDSAHGLCQMLDRRCVDAFAEFGIVFGAVHVGIGGAVDDGVDFLGFDRLHDGIGIGYVEFVDVGEYVAVFAACGDEAHLIAQLSVGAGD